MERLGRPRMLVASTCLLLVAAHAAASARAFPSVDPELAGGWAGRRSVVGREMSRVLQRLGDPRAGAAEILDAQGDLLRAPRARGGSGITAAGRGTAAENPCLVGCVATPAGGLDGGDATQVITPQE